MSYVYFFSEFFYTRIFFIIFWGIIIFNIVLGFINQKKKKEYDEIIMIGASGLSIMLLGFSLFNIGVLISGVALCLIGLSFNMGFKFGGEDKRRTIKAVTLLIIGMALYICILHSFFTESKVLYKNSIITINVVDINSNEIIESMQIKDFEGISNMEDDNYVEILKNDKKYKVYYSECKEFENRKKEIIINTPIFNEELKEISTEKEKTI